MVLSVSTFKEAKPRRLTMKRSRDVIIAKILEICIDGASKTKIVYQANLNFRTVNPYLQLLILNGLIEVKNGATTIYETMPKGKDILESYKIIQRELDDIV